MRRVAGCCKVISLQGPQDWTMVWNSELQTHAIRPESIYSSILLCTTQCSVNMESISIISQKHENNLVIQLLYIIGFNRHSLHNTTWVKSKRCSYPDFFLILNLQLSKCILEESVLRTLNLTMHVAASPLQSTPCTTSKRHTLPTLNSCVSSLLTQLKDMERQKIRYA